MTDFMSLSYRSNTTPVSRLRRHNLRARIHRYQLPIAIVCTILVCLILEVGVFNFAHWQSRGFGEPDSTYSVGKGLQIQTDGSLLVTDRNTATLSFSPESHVNNINVPLTNVIVQSKKLNDASRPTTDLLDTQISNQVLHISVSADEQGATSPWTFPERIVDSNIISSQWIRLHLSGVSHRISVHINENNGTVIKLGHDASLNSRRPFIVNPIRIACYMLAVLLVIALPLLRRGLLTNTSHGEKRVIWVMSFVIALLIVEGALLAMRPWQALRESSWPADFEYQWTAQSIIHGHAWIDYPVSQVFGNIINPYDPWLRQQMFDASGEHYLYDFVFFNGKYYSYFGVLPCLLFFVPFRLLSGTDLSAWKVVALLLLIVIVLAFLVTRMLFRKFAPNVPPLIQALCALGLVVISQPALYLSLTTSAIYSVPIVSAIALAYTAIYLWLCASMQQSRSRSLIYTALGGLAAGLILGCRPQVSVIILLAPVILFHKLNAERNEGIRFPWVTAAITAAVPFLIAALPFLWWNYIRFGSFLDFGATYQLTTTDMRAPKDIISKLPFAFAQSLIMPLGVQDQFPFFTLINGSGISQGGYQGVYMAEPLLGGVLFWFPLGWMILFAYRHQVRKCLLNKTGVSLLLYSCLLLCAILLSVDISVTFLARYMSDWGFLFGIASICAVIMLDNAVTDEFTRRHMYTAIIVLILISVCLCAVAVTMNGRFNQLLSSNPTLFIMIRDAFAVFN